MTAQADLIPTCPRTGATFREGDTITSFRGERMVLRGWYGRPAPSTGRVVTDRGEFYPGAFDLELRPAPPTMGERLMPGCTCGAAARGAFDRCVCD